MESSESQLTQHEKVREISEVKVKQVFLYEKIHQLQIQLRNMTEKWYNSQAIAVRFDKTFSDCSLYSSENTMMLQVRHFLIILYNNIDILYCILIDKLLYI